MTQARVREGSCGLAGLGDRPGPRRARDTEVVPTWSVRRKRSSARSCGSRLRSTTPRGASTPPEPGARADQRARRRDLLRPPHDPSGPGTRSRVRRDDPRAAHQRRSGGAGPHRPLPAHARASRATACAATPADFSDPWRGVLDALMQREREACSPREEQGVLAAAELTPQVVTFLERERVLGVITETGGRFSHGAVLARAFGVPCVVGLRTCSRGSSRACWSASTATAARCSCAPSRTTSTSSSSGLARRARAQGARACTPRCRR